MTPEEAQEARDALAQEIQNIQNQLGDRDYQSRGERLDSKAYWTWRHGAKRALASKLKELREANRVLKEIKQQSEQRTVAAGAKMIWSVAYVLALRDDTRPHLTGFENACHAVAEAEFAVGALCAYERESELLDEGYESACMMLGVAPRKPEASTCDACQEPMPNCSCTVPGKNQRSILRP